MSAEQTGFQPIFVVGNSRSGTTLMAKILARNAVVHTFAELHYFERLWDGDKEVGLTGRAARELCARLLHTVRKGLHSAEPWQEYLEEAGTLLDNRDDGSATGFDVYRTVLEAEICARAKSRGCEQAPRNIYYLADILAEFTEARALVMIRDPRAILLSQKKKWRRKTIGHNNTPIALIERMRRWANYHPVLTSALWEAAINAGERVAADSRVMTVRFEDLVTRPEQTVSGICDFLGLAYDDAMLDVASSLSPTAGGPRAKGGGGIDAAVADRWKTELGAADIYWCERANGKRMRQLGYKLSGTRPAWPVLALSLAGLPPKSGLALLLNLSKMSNIVKSVLRRFA